MKSCPHPSKCASEGCHGCDEPLTRRVARNRELARVLFERAQDGYVNPTGGKTTGRERKDG